jgi:hypothetical protein
MPGGAKMPDYQLRLGVFSKSYSDLTDNEKEFITYFLRIKMDCISSVIDSSYTTGPHGYGSSLVLSRIIKIKERISTDRELSDKLKRNELYRFVSNLDDHRVPSHNTYNSLRKRLGVEGYRQIHSNFVRQADSLGLLNPDISALPKNRKDGIILIADSTFLKTTSSTKGIRTDDGTWLFKDESIAFGRPHHKHKYPVGHRAQTLMTINGIPLVSLLGKASESDKQFIFPLLDALIERYPYLKFSYIILDRIYDSEEIHQGIYEYYEIVPIIIRKKMVYPKGFTKDGLPLCPFNYPMRRKGIDYANRRTQYCCFKTCLNDKDQLLFDCKHMHKKTKFGYSFYTLFEAGYRKYGPALPTMVIYRKLKSYRTCIERTYGLFKENRYRMEMNNTYTGHDNVLMHVIDHDIVLTQDIINDYLSSGKLSPVIKL